jgi:hypothetical protein
MTFTISYPGTPYKEATFTYVNISCITVKPDETTLTYVIQPELPLGLTIDPDTGNIFGQTNFSSISLPTDYTVTATDNFSATAEFILNISINIKPLFYYPDEPTIFKLNVPLDGIAPVPFFSNLPGILYSTLLPTTDASFSSIGLNFNPITGEITGTPNLETPLITYYIQANNQGITADASLNMKIQPTPTFSYPEPSYILTQNIPFSVFPVTTNTNVVIYDISCILPFGLSLNSETGEISGTPTILSTFYNYTIRIRNVTLGSSTTNIAFSVIKEFLAPPVVADNFSSNTFLTDPAIAMRRKAEIFKYKNNSSNLTKQQYFSLLAKGNGPYAKRAWGNQSITNSNPNISGLAQSGNTIICNSNPILCAPTSSSDVPGPIMNLCYDPSVILAGYNQPNRKRVNIGFKWPQRFWQPGDNGFPVGKAGTG